MTAGELFFIRARRVRTLKNRSTCTELQLVQPATVEQRLQDCVAAAPGAVGLKRILVVGLPAGGCLGRRLDGEGRGRWAGYQAARSIARNPGVLPRRIVGGNARDVCGLTICDGRLGRLVETVDWVDCFNNRCH